MSARDRASYARQVIDDATRVCLATLNDAGRIPCQRTDDHEPPRGCRFVADDFADRTHHEHDLWEDC